MQSVKYRIMVPLLTLLPLAAAGSAVTPLPARDLFRPLLADPRGPRFQASVLRAESDLHDSTVGAVGFGENFGITRRAGRHAHEAWQLNLSAAVFAQFDLGAPSDDLVNADYVVGLPVSYRNGAWSVRLRPDRVNLSYESFEALVSYEWVCWRAYGGGEYLVFREPEELAPGVLHAGVEYRSAAPLWQIGRLGAAWPVSGLDARPREQHDWAPAWSFKSGLEFRPQDDVARSGRFWNLLLEYYDGPSPYGQFCTYDVRYLGLGLVLHL